MSQNTNEIIPMHAYQRYAKDFVLSHPYCGLFLEMGLGKTGIVLEALYELNPSCHVLIIAPKTISKVTWTNEIEKWNIPIRTKSMLMKENGKQLTKAEKEELWAEIPDSENTVWFINRDQIPKLVSHFNGKTNPWPFPIVIIDESQSFKSYSAERFKAMRRVRPFMDRVVLLSGSPTPKSLEDLWAQIYLLDMGKRLETTVTKFRSKYFNPGLIVNNNVVTWQPKYNADKEIYNKISDLVISMRNTYLTLPNITFNNVDIFMDKDERQIYNEMLKDKVLTLITGDIIEAANAAVLSVRLSQMASGAIYTGNKTDEYQLIHIHKLEMCEYILNNTDDNVIIAYRFHSDRDMLLSYLKDAGFDPVEFNGEAEMEKKWNNGKIRVMLLQPASHGAGINLQHGGHTLIWYSLPWSLEQYEQTNTRLYRQGQTKPVIIHRLLTKNTIDKRILYALEKKDLSQNALIDAIEVTIKEANKN